MPIHDVFLIGLDLGSQHVRCFLYFSECDNVWFVELDKLVWVEVEFDWSSDCDLDVWGMTFWDDYANDDKLRQMYMKSRKGLKWRL